MHNLKPTNIKTMKKNKKSAPTKVEPKTTPIAPEAKVETKTPTTITLEKVSALKSKIKEAKDPVADATNKDKAIQKIQYERDLTYLYPEDCTSTVDRKVFRQKSRNTIRRMEAQALKLEDTAKKLKMAEILEYRKKVLTNPDYIL
jgi:hypothetical protein